MIVLELQNIHRYSVKYKVESPLATRFSSYIRMDLSIFTRPDICQFLLDLIFGMMGVRLGVA